MRPVITDISEQTSNFKHNLNSRILASINRRGIVPLSEIPENCIVNHIFGSAEVNRTVCVNHIDLRIKPSSEITQALKIALWEEYTGAFGISSERGYRFDMESDHLQTAYEIRARLVENILFVLKPPSETLIVPQGVREGSPGDIRRKGYTTIYDTYSYTRARLLSDGSEIKSTAVTEIKTKHSFSHNQVLAVLVPAHLLSQARQYLRNYRDRIIEVPMMNQAVKLAKIPEILCELFGETITPNVLTCQVPDYENVLLQNILPRYQEFSLHCVRLTNQFDISARIIEDLNASRRLLQTARARIAVRNPDGSGWVLVHKTQLSKPNSKIMSLMPTLVASIRANPATREPLLAAKGQRVMMKTTTAFTPRELSGLQALSASGTQCADVIMIETNQENAAVAKSRPRLRRLGRDFLHQQQQKQEQEQQSAVILQSFFRGRRVRKAFKEVLEAKESLENAEKILFSLSNR